MSVNFYDQSGVMVGVDFHRYFKVVPIPVVGVLGAPQECFPHFVTVPFLWPSSFTPKLTDRVRSDGWKMVQGGFDLYLVPHVPLAKDWGILEVFQIADVIASSSSKAAMTVHSVTGQGAPLATCLNHFLGSNGNCNDWPTSMSCPNTNVVLNFNSVKTTPTLGDYLAYVIGTLLGAVQGYLMGKLYKLLKLTNKITLAIVKHIVRRLKDIWKGFGYILGLPGVIAKWIQQTVDDGGKSIKKGVQEAAKAVEDGARRTQRAAEEAARRLDKELRRVVEGG
jgi:hypothetical protein